MKPLHEWKVPHTKFKRFVAYSNPASVCTDSAPRYALKRIGTWVVINRNTERIVFAPPGKGSRQACRQWIIKHTNKEKQL